MPDCTELIYKEVISYESPERHSRTGPRSANSLQNHGPAVNHTSGMIHSSALYFRCFCN